MNFSVSTMSTSISALMVSSVMFLSSMVPGGGPGPRPVSRPVSDQLVLGRDGRLVGGEMSDRYRSILHR